MPVFYKLAFAVVILMSLIIRARLSAVLMGDSLTRQSIKGRIAVGGLRRSRAIVTLDILRRAYRRRNAGVMC